MKKQKIIPLIFGIFLIGIIIFIMLYKPTQETKTLEEVKNELPANKKVIYNLKEIPPEWKETVESCSQQAEEATIVEDAKSRCLFNEAVKYNETILCLAMNHEKWQSKCFRAIALNTNNIKLCNVIVDEIQKGRCITYFAVQKH